MQDDMMGGFGHRFGGMVRLYGEAGMAEVRGAHVCVVGVGGVGSWAVEGLARSGVGRITMVDWDDVCLSNVNRQLPALSSTVGRAKVEVLAERVAGINPECEVRAVREYFSGGNAGELLEPGFDWVIDAVDRVGVKVELIVQARRRGMKVVTVGGAGGRVDLTTIQVADLSRSFEDPLLSGVRKRLRQEHGYPRDLKERFRVWCVFSPEPILFPQGDGTVCRRRVERSGRGRQSCDNVYGAAAFMTGAFGFAAAQKVVSDLAARAER